VELAPLIPLLVALVLLLLTLRLALRFLQRLTMGLVGPRTLRTAVRGVLRVLRLVLALAGRVIRGPRRQVRRLPTQGSVRTVREVERRW
jgi:hypothetical protein